MDWRKSDTVRTSWNICGNSKKTRIHKIKLKFKCEWNVLGLECPLLVLIFVVIEMKRALNAWNHVL